MGPANLLFLVIAATTPLLSAEKPSNYSMAKPSMLWINNNTQLGNSVVRLILIQDNYNNYGLNFAAGFLCVSAPTCDVYLFAVFIMYVGNGTFLEGDSGQVVWSANEARQVRENATLEFTTGGNVVLRDADGSHVWSSNSSGRSVAGMKITEIGNLVLFDHRNATVWQSFDHPTDTLVPGQSLLEGMRLTASTSGYLAPEWLTSRITEKVDVYSFGVVIMEIISGRKNIDNSQPEENVELINLLREKAQNNQLIDLIDKHSDDMVSHQEEVVKMMKLAIWCLQHDSIQRPSMSTVIKVLEGGISVETFDANSLMYVQDNPSTYSVSSQPSILSGPR